MDVIVVLGSALIKGQLSDENIGRLEVALAIYDQKLDQNPNAQVIFIVSGGGKTTRTEAEAMAEYLISRDVPSENIIQEDSSANTIENIINTSAIIRSLLGEGTQINSIIYVSSEYHIERITRILSYFGVEGIPLFASGSKIFPEWRTTNEQKLLQHIDKSISQYL